MQKRVDVTAPVGQNQHPRLRPVGCDAGANIVGVGALLGYGDIEIEGKAITA